MALGFGLLALAIGGASGERGLAIGIAVAVAVAVPAQLLGPPRGLAEALAGAVAVLLVGRQRPADDRIGLGRSRRAGRRGPIGLVAAIAAFDRHDVRA